MKEKSTTAKRKTLYYAVLTVSALLLAAATILTVYFVVGGDEVVDTPPVATDPDNTPDVPSEPTGPSQPDVPSDGEDTVRFTNPVENLAVLSGYGFYHNQTLGWYYEHDGLDVAAEEGTEVFAMANGTVESIRTDELTGTEIILDHGDGLKTTYRFVAAAENLAVGTSVVKGQTIATVAAATGAEYKDGAHLHLEVTLDGEHVDPVAYLTLEEK